MKATLIYELRSLLPVWLVCAVLPLPAVILARANEGVPWRMSCFSISCAILATYVFRHEIRPGFSLRDQHPRRIWNVRMASLMIALIGSIALYSTFCLMLDNPRDLVQMCKAIYVSVLAICIVPCLTLATRKPFAAIVFSIMLVFCMKLLGCVVVVLVHGWNADKLGYTTTPWKHPNLLVWFFLASTTLLSWTCYSLGKRRFQKIYTPQTATTNGAAMNTGLDFASQVANAK